MENMGGKSQNEILGMENTIVRFIISLDGINNQKPQKKRPENLKTQQQKLSKMKHKEKNG